MREIPAAWWMAAGVYLVLVLLLMRQRQISARLRRQAAGDQEQVRQRDAEVRYLAERRLPVLATRTLAQSPGVPPMRDEGLTDTEFGFDLQRVVGLVTGMVDEAHRQADHAVRNTLAGIVTQIQGLMGVQEIALREATFRHEDSDVLADMFALDHLNAQMSRKAQALLVLCGCWVGRQRDASTLTDVVRGAISKVGDYKRVRSVENDSVAVTAHAVEPVVLCIAELLENALRFSDPNAPVSVTVTLVFNGVSITVTDAGIGMTDQQVHQARAVLTGEATVDITRLGDPPRIGLAAIAALAKQYGFYAFLDGRSGHGGVSATLFLPKELLRGPEPRPAPAQEPAASLDPHGPVLPQRTRRASLAAPSGGGPVPVRAAAPAGRVRGAWDPGRLGDFQSGLRDGAPHHSDLNDR